MRTCYPWYQWYQSMITQQILSKIFIGLNATISGILGVGQSWQSRQQLNGRLQCLLWSEETHSCVVFQKSFLGMKEEPLRGLPYRSLHVTKPMTVQRRFTEKTWKISASSFGMEERKELRMRCQQLDCNFFFKCCFQKLTPGDSYPVIWGPRIGIKKCPGSSSNLWLETIN